MVENNVQMILKRYVEADATFVETEKKVRIQGSSKGYENVFQRIIRDVEAALPHLNGMYLARALIVKSESIRCLMQAIVENLGPDDIDEFYNVIYDLVYLPAL